MTYLSVAILVVRHICAPLNNHPWTWTAQKPAAHASQSPYGFMWLTPGSPYIRSGFDVDVEPESNIQRCTIPKSEEGSDFLLLF